MINVLTSLTNEKEMVIIRNVNVIVIYGINVMAKIGISRYVFNSICSIPASWLMTMAEW